MNITALQPSSIHAELLNRLASTPADTSNFGYVFKNKLNTNTSLTNTQAVINKITIPNQSAANVDTPSAVNSDQHLSELLYFQNRVHESSPAQADEIARNFAFYGGGLALTLPTKDGKMWYMDGTPYEGAYGAKSASFYKDAGIFQQAQIQLYETETAKGTPPAQIYDKLVNAVNNQPTQFRTMMGWPLNYPTD